MAVGAVLFSTGTHWLMQGIEGVKRQTTPVLSADESGIAAVASIPIHIGKAERLLKLAVGGATTAAGWVAASAGINNLIR